MKSWLSMAVAMALVIIAAGPVDGVHAQAMSPVQSHAPGSPSAMPNALPQGLAGLAAQSATMLPAAPIFAGAGLCQCLDDHASIHMSCLSNWQQCETTCASNHYSFVPQARFCPLAAR